MTADEKLQAIAQEVQTCTRCPLHQGRTNAVPGAGSSTTRVMFIGEGPGYHEDRKGLPFVGPAGKFLDELLLMAGMQRPEVFIGNVIKCRPPQNRDPQPDEIHTCTTTFLYRQIEVIDPTVIVTLGRFSMALFMPNEKISRIHGQPRIIDGRLVVPMMHPAAALHQPKNRSLIEDDFRRLPEILAQAEQAEQAEHEQADTSSEPAASDNTASGTRSSDNDGETLEQLSMF